jgi:hypothetical protein
MPCYQHNYLWRHLTMNKAKVFNILFAVCLCIGGLLCFSDQAAHAQVVGTHVKVADTGGANATLGIPRWKGHVHPDDPNKIWVSFTNASTVANNISFTTDGGHNWSTNNMNPGDNGYLDYHASLFGVGDNLYFTFPKTEGIQFSRFDAPATSNADRSPIHTFPATTAAHRSNVSVDGNGRVWVFTRLSDTPSQNVRYHYSDDNGLNWTSNLAVDTGSANVRIGSMPYVDGRMCLVILHLNSNRGYEYYLWNGTYFEPQADFSIWPQNMGYTRVFSHNTIGGDAFHLVFGLADDLHHVWKTHQGGTGSWNHQIIESSAATTNEEWLPITTVRGNELFMFYCRQTSDEASSQIYMRRWSQADTAWDDAVLVSNGGTTSNVHPNTGFSIPSSSDTIPVFWTGDADGGSIYFNTVEVPAEVGMDDTEPPAAVDDFNAESSMKAGAVGVSWTAPGDDGLTGQATSYDIRYSTEDITHRNWDDATPLPSPPLPEPAGVAQSMLIESFLPGQVYYLALKTQDEAGNLSPISNTTSAMASSTSSVPTPGPGHIQLLQNSPNPFNPNTVIRFVLKRGEKIRLSIYDPAGRRIRVLMDEYLGAGEYRVDWNGRSSGGNHVASGVYYARLFSSSSEQTIKMTMVQ